MEDKTHFSQTLNTIDADDLATQGTRASLALIMTVLSRNTKPYQQQGLQDQ